MMENEMEEDRNEGPPRKRLLTDPNPKRSFVAASPESTVSSDSSSDRFAKKTRDLPNLSDCHSCAVHINYTNPRERLQPLESMWRVVLLCKKCTKRVKSSELCPYCFSDAGADEDCFKCRDCQHSIHKDCVAKYGSVLGFSVCVDCWVPDAVASSIRARKMKSRKNNKESCDPPSTLPKSRVSAGEEVESAKGVLNVVSNTNVAGSSNKKVVDDKNLAFMLHRAINCSPRISKYTCLMSSFTGDNAQMTCYSRRRANKKTSLMKSGNLGVPIIFYSRRRVKNGLRNSVTSNSPLIFYSRRRSSGNENSMDSHRFLLKYHRIGKGNSRPSVFVKDSDCGSYIDSSNVNNEDTSDVKDLKNGEICEISDKNVNRFLLKYKRSKAPVFLGT